MSGHSPELGAPVVEGPIATRSKRHFSGSGQRWWAVGAGSVLVLTTIAIAAVVLLTRKPATIDQLIILTVPSGAEIKIDSRPFGRTPVKLEQLATGTYQLTIEKENYETIEQSVTVTADTSQLEFKLKVLPSPEVADTNPEEAIKAWQEKATEAFARGQYMIPYEGSAISYVQQIQRFPEANEFAAEMSERIRRIELQVAREATSSSDFAKARDIYNKLSEFYSDNDEVRIANARFENQMAQRRGDVLNYVKKANDALAANNLLEPEKSCAFYFAGQALAIDRQNSQARTIYNRVKEILTTRAEDAFHRGDLESAIKQLSLVTQKFSDDKALHQRLRDWESQRSTEVAKAADPENLRSNGLDAFGRGEYAAAIHDLEIALANGRTSPEVIFALGRSYMMTGNLDKAGGYLRQVPAAADNQYRSAIASLGDIAYDRGDTAAALEKYKQARALGGSTLYSVAKLDDKIEQIEKKERAKSAEPIPITIRVKHMHGGFISGSCTGTLSADSTGVRYDGSEHTFSSNLLAAGVRISKDEMVVKFQDKNEKFRVSRSDADRFSETLSRYQQFYSPANK